MGITENYRMIKTPCRTCDESGIVLVPVDENGENAADIVDWLSPLPEGVKMVEEECPICEKKGWYYIERED